MTRFLFFLLLVTSTLFAQKKFTISGKVVEQGTQQPLEYATVVFEDPQNKTSLVGGISDAKGIFHVEVPQGIYNLKISFFSFKEYSVKNFNVKASTDIGTIALSENIAELDAVEVVAERSTVEMRLDKKIYNVGSDMLVKGGSITDVLGNVPSVSVDLEGTISLRGSENVKILINGKPSALSGMDSQTLQQLPAESIEKIEVITNPSARYDAQGTAGIINIVLKQGKGLGFTGSTSVNAGFPNNYGASLNLNLRKNKWTFFNNTSLQYREHPQTMAIEQQLLNSEQNVKSFQNENRNSNRIRKGLSLNLGAEYRLNNKTSITNSIVWNKRDQNKSTQTFFENFDAEKNPVSSRNRWITENEKDQGFQYSLNFERKFDKDGHRFTADYQFSTNLEKSSGVSNETLLENQNLINHEETFSDESIKEHLLQMDYTLPIDEQTQFEAGYRGKFSESDTDYRLGETQNGTFVANSDFSNRFIYNENIQALYTQLGTKFGAFNLMAGLRMEHTAIVSTLVNTHKNYPKNYLQWFPSLFLGYSFSENSQVSLNYTRRLQRPHSRALNPFITREGRTNLFSGNPNLDASLTNSFEAGFLNRWEQFSLNASVYYRNTTQAFNFVALETGDVIDIENADGSVSQVPVMIRQPINLATENHLGVEFATTYTPFPRWKIMWDLNFFKRNTTGNYSYENSLGETVSQNFNSQNYSWFSRMNIKIPLPYQIDMNTMAMYMGPNKDAQSSRKGEFGMDLALSKEVFNKKGTISLNIRDLFNSRRMISDTHTPNVNTHSQMQWRTRQISLNLTYRFGNNNSPSKKKPKQNRNDDSSFEEMTY